MENKSYFLKENLFVELESVLFGHNEGITGLRFVNDGFVSCSLDCTVIKW